MHTPFTYSPPRKALHWLSAALIAAAFALIWSREALDDTTQRMLLLQWHRLAGLLILALTVVRLAFRLNQGASPPPPGAKRVEVLAAGLIHAAFYPALLALPLLGWAYTSAKGRVFDLFGVIQLPALLNKDPVLASLLGEAHELAAYALLGAVGLHAGAALLHRFTRRDGVLERMLFSRSI